LKFLRSDAVVAHVLTPSSIRLSLKSGDVLEAALWVGAEGRHSSLKQHVSFGQTRRHYGQHALVFDVAHTEAHGGRAFEHFTPDGPLAFLPLQGKRSAVVWSLSSELALSLKENPEALLHALIQHFGWGLGELTLAGDVSAYPLSLEMPWQTVSPRCLLIGDAAHAIHPVAGQGLNVGLRDVMRLVDHFQKTKERGLDSGSLTVLQAYDQQRKKDRWSMAAVTHALVRGFERPALRRPAAVAWDASVGMIKAFPVLKRRIMRHAMGLDAS
jgi:2-octaprenyl-6-methoxyphenol hydroxylase